MEKQVTIRRAEAADAQSLAYVQTESWKDAFRQIVPEELLLKCTDADHAAQMYRRLLTQGKGNGYLLELEGKPHCIAWWDASREPDMPGFAELICIHSLKENRHKGYGSRMMEKVLEDIRSAGYDKVMLWVFDNNLPAIRFYEAHGFVPSGKKQPAFGAVEEMYIKGNSE